MHSSQPKDSLDSIQARALRVSCGAMVATPNSALLVECGELPVQLRREQQMVKYAINVRSTVNHPWQHVQSYRTDRQTIMASITNIQHRCLTR